MDGWDGGRGRRGRGRRGGRNFSAPAYTPTPEEQARWHRESTMRQIQHSLFQLGDGEEFEPAHELPRAAAWLEGQAVEFPDAIFAAFRVMTTEQPHKAPLIAALVGQLALAPGALDGTATLGARILNDLLHAYEDYCAGHYWRNMRLVLCFFSALLPLGLVSAASMRDALKALTSGLATLPRDAADGCAFAVIETLCRAGTNLLQADDHASPKAELDELVDSVRAYAEKRTSYAALYSPLHLDRVPEEYAYLSDEGFAQKVHALEALQARGYRAPAMLASPLDLLPTTVSPLTTHVPLEQRLTHLPAVPIPAERRAALDLEREMEYSGPDTGKGGAEARHARTGPAQRRMARWFGATVPAPGTPAALVVRTLAEDIVDLYVVNRKECAQTLLALPLWLRRGTFGGKVPPSKGLFGDEEPWNTSASGDGPPEGPWSLEDLIVETVLASLLALPSPPQNELYYASLLREIVGAAPQQIAPSLGRTVRRFYAASAAGCVRAETLRRLANWFSVHLSNFNFTWAWTEWVADAELPWPHARRAFARRLAELEVRLAYYDRIKSTVPEALQPSLLPPEEPAPVFTYAAPSHPYHGRAMQLLNSLKAKASVQVIQADLSSFEQSILAPANDVPDVDDDENGMVTSAALAEQIVRDMAMQTLLHAGSRSFSHLLNMIERYHDLLRSLSQTPQARVEMLGSTVRFWARSPQWVLIVMDKLLQYRIVEPVDVVSFVFTPPSDTSRLLVQGSGDQVPFSFSASAQELGGTLRDWSSFNWWAVLCLTVEKVVGRVDQLTRRLDELLRAEAQGDAPAADHLPARPGTLPANSTTSDEAKVHLDAIQLEQRRVLVTVVQQFVQLINSVHAWDAQPNAEDASAATWQAWWIREWYCEFLALYREVLAANRETILANVFAAAKEDDRALRLFDEACG